MQPQYVHLVFYDGECGFATVPFNLLLKLDKDQQFAFAPLQGLTAAHYLKDLPTRFKNVDSFNSNRKLQNSTSYLYSC